jgi:hypothetical protein
MDIENLNQASFKEYLDSCGVNENTMIFALNCFEYGRQSANKNKPKWVGLTDEEIDKWFVKNTVLNTESGRNIARAIEAILREKQK